MATEQEWHHSASSCCSPFGTCCLSWWCPCILYGRARHRTRNNGDMQSYSCCNGSCFAFSALTCVGIPFILPMMNRGDMRAKYGLKGNGCGDCMRAFCCGPCDLSQQDKEAEFREAQRKAPLLGQPGAMGQGQGMQYKPQQQQQQQQQYHHH